MDTNQRLERIEQTQKEQSQTQKEHSQTLKEHSQTLKEHGQTQKEHSRILKKHSRKLDDLRRRLDTLQEDVNELKEAGGRRDETLAFIIEKIDDYREEGRRHLEVLLEHHRGEMAAIRDAVTGNRERLEDHEDRLVDLESA